MNPSVVGIDVVDRSITKDGVLKSHRLLSTKWGLPDWATKMITKDRICYASEHSEVDPKNKTMRLVSRNLSLCSIITVDENLVYAPHPTDDSRTHLKQEAVVNVKGIPLSSYMESLVADTISNNAHKGRQAMEWVIAKIKTEADDLKQEAQKCMHTVHNVLPKSSAQLS
ncbi:hypothetical protein ScPMuIL_000325 [Solemya velum]